MTLLAWILVAASSAGEAHFNDAQLAGLGTNGRACATCHVPEEAFQLSPRTVERRYAALLAKSPPSDFVK